MLESIKKNISKNNIKSYNDMIYGSRPVKLSEFLSDKYNIVHRKIYDYSLNNCLYDFINTDFVDNTFMRYMYNICFNMDVIDNNSLYEENISLINEKINNLNIKNIEVINDIKTKVIDIVQNLKENIKAQKDYIDELINLNNITYIYLEEDLENIEISEDIDSLDNTIAQFIYLNNGNIMLYISNTIKEQFDRDFLFNTNNLIDEANRNIRKMIVNTFIFHFKKSHKFIEIKNTEYWKPSSVVIIDTKYPYSKKIVDLQKYWNKYQSKEEYNINKLKITKDQNILDSEIEEINYITGKAKMYSKASDINYEIDFNYIDENTVVNDDIFLSNTFTYKYKNKNK